MLVMLALFVALEIVLVRFIGITTPILRISFGFLPIALAGVLYGPLVAGFTGMIANMVGVFMFPPATGAPFWGFTVSAFLTGACYGFFLHNRGHSLKHIIAACAVHLGVIAMIINTYWLTILTGAPFIALLPTRLPAQLVMMPVQTIMIFTTWKYLARFLSTSQATT